jgi:hypothetical protein
MNTPGEPNQTDVCTEESREMAQTQTQSTKAQSFEWGCELEVTIAETAIRERGIQIGGYHHGIQLPAPFPQGWTAERDASIYTDRPGHVGVEIVSPILKGADGIEQVKWVAGILREMGAAVSTSCGMHCHIGVASVVGLDYTAVAAWVGKLLSNTAMHETALYASTGTHRRETGRYSRSVKLQKQAADKVRKAPDSRKPEALRDVVYGLDRYHALNLTNLFTSKRTCEYRFAAGTLSDEKLVGHICTCLALAERATETTRMNWDAVASERTYSNRGKGLRELNRFFYLAGWTLGRREVGKAEVSLAGWIAPLEDLKPVQRTMRRLARKYDSGTQE